MAIHLADSIVGALPEEPLLLPQITLRLIEDSERERFDQILTSEHYLNNPTTVGEALRYVAEFDGQWLALLVFASPALHLKPRDRWLEWDVRRLAEPPSPVPKHSFEVWLINGLTWVPVCLSSRPIGSPRTGRKPWAIRCSPWKPSWIPNASKPPATRPLAPEHLGPTRGFERTWKDFYTDT